MKQRILVVDDEQGIRQSLAVVLADVMPSKRSSRGKRAWI